MLLAAGRRFQRLNRQTADGFNACRGTEMKGERISAHTALMGTFDNGNEAKTTMTMTCASVFSGRGWNARNKKEIIATQRMFSSGQISLVHTVDAALNAYGDNDGTTPVFEAMGASLIEAGLAAIDTETGECVDGPRLVAARATLLDQGYSVHSMAMKSLTIETVLVVWLNMVQADPVCKFRLPDFV